MTTSCQFVSRQFYFCIKPSFHTYVSRTHHSARCLKMYGYQWSQAITVFATKACELATKSHMLNFCEGLCRDMLWQWSIETNNARKKRFPVFQKKRAKPQITTTFGKSLFLILCKEKNNNFCPPRKKSKVKKKLTMTFGKSLFLIKCKEKEFLPSEKKEQS